MTFLGIDIGTSAVKAVLVDDAGGVIGETAAPLSVSRPRRGWSEQDPDEWWRAAEAVAATLRRDSPDAFGRTAAIGLSGQMHGLVALDGDGRPVCPAILWNDGRAREMCARLEAAVPDLGRTAGVIAMPGFTAPKLLWLRRHRPDAFARIETVLLAKDYVRWKLTGVFATDMADAAGTLFLDEAVRDWADRILAAVGISREQLPTLFEGSAATGIVRAEVAAAWHLPSGVIVAAGAGDAAAGAIGIGAVDDGDSFISLGTSAQFFVTRDRYEPKPETLIHAFAHGLPNRWFEMAAMLNGATVLDWAVKTFADGNIDAALAAVERSFRGPSPVLFLPYLSGERTPHNDPDARGAFYGFDAATEATDLIQATLEGVAFAFMDAQRALGVAGRQAPSVGAVGGGARSRFWLKLIASALRLPVLVYSGAEKGPAFGAARLARLALTGDDPAVVCTKPSIVATVLPDAALADAYGERFERYRAIYPAIRRAKQS